MNAPDPKATLRVYDARVASWRALRSLDAALDSGQISVDAYSALTGPALEAYGAVLAATAQVTGLAPCGMLAAGGVA